MAYHDDGYQVRVQGHVAEWYGVLDMSLVCQVVAVSAIQKVTCGNAQSIPVDVVGYVDLLHRGKQG